MEIIISGVTDDSSVLSCFFSRCNIDCQCNGDVGSAYNKLCSTECHQQCWWADCNEYCKVK